MKTLLLAVIVILLAAILGVLFNIEHQLTPEPVVTERAAMLAAAQADGYCGSAGCDLDAWMAAQ